MTKPWSPSSRTVAALWPVWLLPPMTVADELALLRAVAGEVRAGPERLADASAVAATLVHRWVFLRETRLPNYSLHRYVSQYCEPMFDPSKASNEMLATRRRRVQERTAFETPFVDAVLSELAMPVASSIAWGTGHYRAPDGRPKKGTGRLFRAQGPSQNAYYQSEAQLRWATAKASALVGADYGELLANCFEALATAVATAPGPWGERARRECARWQAYYWGALRPGTWPWDSPTGEEWLRVYASVYWEGWSNGHAQTLAKVPLPTWLWPMGEWKNRAQKDVLDAMATAGAGVVDGMRRLADDIATGVNMAVVVVGMLVVFVLFGGASGRK